MLSTREAAQKHLDMQHAMQTGIKIEGMETLKDLRVGVNTAQCDNAGLVHLLVSKGIITEQEYANAIADEMTEEVKRYERRISKATGKDITLL